MTLESMSRLFVVLDTCSGFWAELPSDLALQALQAVLQVSKRMATRGLAVGQGRAEQQCCRHDPQFKPSQACLAMQAAAGVLHGVSCCRRAML